MAISLIGSPDEFSPAYNPVWYYFDSTNKNLQGFRYIVDLYQRTGAAPSARTLIHRYRLAPRPGDGYGGFNVSRVLSTYLTSELPNIAHGTSATNSNIRYDIEVGEEYNSLWNYSDYEFHSSSDQWNGYTQLRNFETPLEAHGFTVGDQVFVDQIVGAPFPAINGLHTVVKVPDQYTIVIDLVFPGSGPFTPGTVVYADNSKILNPDLYDVTDKSVFNGAVAHTAYLDYASATEFALSTTNLGDAITTCPKEFTVRPTTRMVFNWFNDYGNNLYYIYGQNSNGTVRRRLVVNNGQNVQANPVGPANINLTTLISGSGALIQSDTEWYEVWTANSSGVRTSAVYRFNINRACTKFPEREVVFLDRLGSLGSFSFIARSEESMSVTREEHKFILGDLMGSKWDYTTYEAGSMTTNVDATETYTLRTSWLTDEESLYFKEMVSSPVTYMDYGFGLFPVIMETTSITVGRRPQDKKIQYELTVRLANNNIINI